MNSSFIYRWFPSHTHWLMIIFVFSGFAGLIYQSIWSHYLGLFLGHAAYAQALVLAIFMGGMALGSALVVRVGARWKNLIRIYALIELVIGLCSLAFHEVFLWVLDLSYNSVIPALGGMSVVYVYKWGLAALLILPQSILLGMTFPLMSSGVIRHEPNKDGQILGGLYFTNSIGAAIGVLFCAFLIMPNLGLHGAIWVAGVMNLCVALAAFIVASSASSFVNENNKKTFSLELSSEKRRLLLLMLGGTFFSGAASFVYEVVWIRMLSLAVGSTLHAFELMLATFIAGIAFGGLWIRRRADSSVDPLKLLGWMQIIMGVLVALSLLIYASSFDWSSFLIKLLNKTEAGYSAFNIGTAILAIAIMFPAAFFAGTTLPLFTVILLRNGVGESAIGRVYAWNTLGAILGVFAAIHILIPFLGLKLAASVAALVDIVIGLIFIRMSIVDDKEFARYGLLGLGILCLFSLVLLKAPFDPAVLSSGVYRHGIAHHTDNRKMLFYRDGKTSSVSVFVTKESVAIATNGKPDASISLVGRAPTADEYTMTLIGALPFAYIDQPKRIGIIGFGSGMTSHVALGSESVTQVDTVEIEKVMVDGARAYEKIVWRAYNDSRSNIVIDDAKSYFSGQQKYDVVISEPSNPWISGIGNLFSKEFYQLVPNYLNDDGVFVQWLQLYEINDQLVSTVLKALTANFTDYHAYLSNNVDLIIVASPKRKLTKENLNFLLGGGMGADFSRLGITSAQQIQLFKIADADVLRAYANMYSGQPNSDYFPVLTMRAPVSRFMETQASLMMGLSNTDFPVLESMGVKVISESETPLSFTNSMPSQFRKINQAYDIRSVFMGAANHKAVSEGFILGENLKRALTSCSDQNSDNLNEIIWVKNLVQLSKLTIPYLHAKQQEGVLINPSWIACETLSPDARKLFSIVSAMAGRNYLEVKLLSVDWLKTITQRSVAYDEANKLVFAYLQLAHIATGEYQDAKAVDDEYGALVGSMGGYDMIRAFILSWLDVKIRDAQ